MGALLSRGVSTLDDMAASERRCEPRIRSVNSRDTERQGGSNCCGANWCESRGGGKSLLKKYVKGLFTCSVLRGNNG